MDNSYKSLLEKAKFQKKSTKKLLSKLKQKKNQKEVDKLFFDAHDETFEEIDCLKCANCCKTTGPLFTSKDIKRISNKLNLSEQNFIDKYLKIDEDNDYVLQQTPCIFLDLENFCSIYEWRPKACREYPHTDRNKQAQLFNLTAKNAEICPAVSNILEKIRNNINKPI